MKNFCFSCKTGLLLWAILLLSSAVQAQLVYQTPWGITYKMYTDQGGVCDLPTGTRQVPFVFNNDIGIQNAFTTVPYTKYFKARQGVPFTFTVEIVKSGGLTGYSPFPFNVFVGTDAPPYLYDLELKPSSNPVAVTNEYGQGVAYTFTLQFVRGDSKGWVVVDLDGNGFILPFVVEGVADFSAIPIIGTTVQPQLPYFILHAPPGDGSTAEFQETKTVCREISQSAATDNSSSGYVDVKVGVAGSVGFIATVNYEFSVTVGASAGGGEMSLKSKGNQTCLTVTEGFQTPPGSEDVFIGYGVDIAYGVGSEIFLNPNTCRAESKPSGLVYMPIGQPRQFFYTKSEVQDQIVLQQGLANDTSLSVRVRNNAQNQVDVWNKVLAMNEANVNNPNNASLGAVSFGTVPSSQESAITVTETASIEYEHYVDYSASLDVVVEVGGSGVSGGYEYRGSQRYGAIENQSQELTKIVRYTLSDDDSGDLFNVNIVRDPMFGTPVFRKAGGTKSSCPYQGGYQRDQPRLKHDGTADAGITLLGTPVGSSAIFKVDLCNESNEARTYNLKLNALSNLNGAVVSAAGVPLNGNDLGQTFSIPANSCLQDLVIEVRQLSANSPLAYPNLELFLYSPCEEDIQSNIFASVYFGNATGADEPAGNINQLSVYPNPASGMVNVAFDLADSAPVRMEVRDLLGRVQMIGFDENMPAGAQQKQLNIRALPTGMYLLDVQSKGGRVTRKLMVE